MDDTPNVSWWSDCYPEFTESDLWWLATSQVLADAEARWPGGWRSALLAFCGWLDELERGYEVAQLVH